MLTEGNRRRMHGAAERQAGGSGGSGAGGSVFALHACAVVFGCFFVVSSVNRKLYRA